FTEIVMLPRIYYWTGKEWLPYETYKPGGWGDMIRITGSNFGDVWTSGVRATRAAIGISNFAPAIDGAHYGLFYHFYANPNRYYRVGVAFYATYHFEGGVSVTTPW